jgi:ceramide glucosyltransferase
MRVPPFLLMQGLLTLLALCGCGYYALCLWSAVRFLKRREKTGSGTFLPPVSILKPLRGIDPEIYASLRSHCLLDYPEYEIIFGVSDPADPAIAHVQELAREFPQHPIRLVMCEHILGGNIKVSNLVQMLPEARYEFLLVNDSDIRVEPDYLRRVVAPLADVQTGLVTCLYRGVAAPTLGSRLEAMGISTDFCGGVLAAVEIEGGLRFGLGSTLIFRKADLKAVDSFAPLLDYLADDYQLGQRLAASGRVGYLSEVVVDTFLPAYTWRAFFDHQLRWARSVRDSRGWGYLGVSLTFGLPWAMLNLLVARGAVWAWGVLAAVFALRLTMAAVVGLRVAGDWQVRRWWWLIPLRDVVALGVWAVGYLGKTVVWRGDRFLLRDGKLEKIAR